MTATVTPLKKSDVDPNALEAIERGHFGPVLDFDSTGTEADAVNRIASLRTKAPQLADAVARFQAEVFGKVSGGSEEERRARVARFMRNQRAEFNRMREEAMAKATEEAMALAKDWRDQKNRDVQSDPMVNAIVQRLAVRGATADELKAWRQSGDLSIKLALAATPSELSGLDPVIRDRLDTELRATLRPDITAKADALNERVQQLDTMRAGFDRLMGRVMDPAQEAHWAEIAEKEGIK